MTTSTPTAKITLPRRGRPPYVVFNEARTTATVNVRGQAIVVPLTRGGNVSPSFVSAAGSDEQYAISVVLRALS